VINGVGPNYCLILFVDNNAKNRRLFDRIQVFFGAKRTLYSEGLGHILLNVPANLRGLKGAALGNQFRLLKINHRTWKYQVKCSIRNNSKEYSNYGRDEHGPAVFIYFYITKCL